ncbi:MAG: DUF1329 domain-containing protein [Candidatus Binataceae bacterium]|nr:DUF1329 domain-containing protein [Candidatus Binataceae bacterium]
MKRMIVCAIAFMVFAIGWNAGGAPAQADDSEYQYAGVPTSPGPVPPGTVINMQNWQQYKQYIPDGMQKMMAGETFWKMPADFEIEIGPTHNFPLPKEFNADTEKYSSQVKIVHSADGSRTITGYVAGMPFPNPTEPDKGWKILVNMWYVYVPHLFCGYDTFYLQDRYGNMQAEKGIQVYRKLSHISDYGQPVNDPRAAGIYYSEYIMLTEPEQVKYTANLTLYYTDLSKPIDTFLFIPALRRSLRLSAGARCSPVVGTDYAQDDANKSNFNGDWRIFDANVIGEGQTLQMMTISSWKNVGNLDNYYRPVFFPKPIIGKFEIRPTWKLDVRRIPSRAQGYCYTKSVMYVDKVTYVSQNKEIYDAAGKFWKMTQEMFIGRNVPHEGYTDDTDNWFGPMWDMQAAHLTMGMSTDPQGDAWKFNEDCKNYQGRNFDDIGHYSLASGLSQILR